MSINQRGLGMGETGGGFAPRTRRELLRDAALAGASLALSPTLARAAGGPGARPNILVILSDDHSAPHVG